MRAYAILTTAPGKSRAGQSGKALQRVTPGSEWQRSWRIDFHEYTKPCFTQEKHFFGMSFFFFFLMLKYIYHKIYHFNQFEMYNSMALITFTICATITTISKIFFIIPNRNSVTTRLLRITSHSSSPHELWVTSNPFSVSVNLPTLDISYKWIVQYFSFYVWLIHLVCVPGSCMLQHVSEFPCFLWLNNMPL